MSKTRLQIVLGGTTLNAYNYRTGNPDDLAIIDNSDWHNSVDVRRNSTTILWQDGETESTDANLEPRYMEITLFAQRDPAGLVALRRILSDAWQAIDTNRTLTMTTYSETGAELLRETIKAKFDSKFVWRQQADTVEFTLYFKAANPRFTVYVNGAVEPLTGGRV